MHLGPERSLTCSCPHAGEMQMPSHRMCAHVGASHRRLQVRIALEVHARQLGTSLVDLVRNVATHPDTFRSATFSASQRFTPSRHASLLRVAGGTHPAAAAAVAAAGSEPGSPVSDVSDEVVPVAMLEPEVDGGDEPTMQIKVRAAFSPSTTISRFVYPSMPTYRRCLG